MFLLGSRRAGACISVDDPQAPLYINLFSFRRVADIAPWLGGVSLVLKDVCSFLFDVVEDYLEIFSSEETT